MLRMTTDHINQTEINVLDMDVKWVHELESV